MSDACFCQIIYLCHYLGLVIFEYKMPICILSLTCDNHYCLRGLTVWCLRAPGKITHGALNSDDILGVALDQML